MGSMAGRIGGIICPVLTGITSLPWLYPLVFGCACTLAGFLILFLPETAGKPMLSTIEEAEAYYRNRAETVTASIRHLSVFHFESSSLHEETKLKTPNNYKAVECQRYRARHHERHFLYISISVISNTKRQCK